MATEMGLGIPVDNQSFNYDSTSSIPWVDFEKVLDAKWFSTDIVGAQIVDDNEHSWRIIKAGDDYYDLWYEESIGNNVFNSSRGIQQNCYWPQSQLRTNLNGPLFYDNTAKLPTNMKNRVIDKEVNAAWFKFRGSYQAGGTNKSNDKVWLLTATEIGAKTVAPTIDTAYGATISAFLIGDGDPYDYFLDDVNKRKSTKNSGRVAGSYNYMWLATGDWSASLSYAIELSVIANGSFSGNYVDYSHGVVPGIRVQ